MTWQELQNRKIKLALMTELPNYASYAEEWNKLAMEFEAIGAPANAEVCRACWRHYRDLAGKEYTSYIQQPALVPERG